MPNRITSVIVPVDTSALNLLLAGSQCGTMLILVPLGLVSRPNAPQRGYGLRLGNVRKDGILLIPRRTLRSLGLLGLRLGLRLGRGLALGRGRLLGLRAATGLVLHRLASAQLRTAQVLLDQTGRLERLGRTAHQVNQWRLRMRARVNTQRGLNVRRGLLRTIGRDHDPRILEPFATLQRDSERFI